MVGHKNVRKDGLIQGKLKDKKVKFETKHSVTRISRAKWDTPGSEVKNLRSGGRCVEDSDIGDAEDLICRIKSDTVSTTASEKDPDTETYCTDIANDTFDIMKNETSYRGVEKDETTMKSGDSSHDVEKDETTVQVETKEIAVDGNDKPDQAQVLQHTNSITTRVSVPHDIVAPKKRDSVLGRLSWQLKSEKDKWKVKVSEHNDDVERSKIISRTISIKEFTESIRRINTFESETCTYLEAPAFLNSSSFLYTFARYRPKKDFGMDTSYIKISPFVAAKYFRGERGKILCNDDSWTGQLH